MSASVHCWRETSWRFSNSQLHLADKEATPVLLVGIEALRRFRCQFLLALLEFIQGVLGTHLRTWGVRPAREYRLRSIAVTGSVPASNMTSSAKMIATQTIPDTGLPPPFLPEAEMAAPGILGDAHGLRPFSAREPQPRVLGWPSERCFQDCALSSLGSWAIRMTAQRPAPSNGPCNSGGAGNSLPEARSTPGLFLRPGLNSFRVSPCSPARRTEHPI